MSSERHRRGAGLAAVVGGCLGLAVTPLMVLVKYSTGWAIIPEPAWVASARPALEPLLSFASPVRLWILYGSLYSLALLLMLGGVMALRSRPGGAPSRGWTAAWWGLFAGLVMVLVGDAVHTGSWHLGGATVPRANLNPIASAGISIEYLGLPLVFVSSFVLGLLSIRGARLPLAASILLLAAAPGGVFLTVTQLPAMPSGSLSIFSVLMIVLGSLLFSARQSTRGAPAH